MLKLNIQRFNDGEVVIGVKIKEEDLDKGIQEVTAKMDKLRQKAEEPYYIGDVKVTGEWTLSDEEQAYYEQLEATLKDLNDKKYELLLQDIARTKELEKQNLASQSQVSNLKADKDQVQGMREQIESMVNIYKEMKSSDISSASDIEYVNNLKNDIIQTANEYEKLSGEKLHIKGITDTESKFNKVTDKIKSMSSTLKSTSSKADLSGLSKKIDNVGKSVTGVVKKVAKWGLALFGIRSAYSMIRQSVSSVSQYNEGLANQIQFMKTTLATALEPVIKRIISLVYTLLSFINSIVKKLTGKDLFAQAKKNLQSGSNSAKEIKKQLAGFDEMNVLSDSSSSGGGGGFDTSGFVGEDTKLLGILEEFKKMFETGDWAGIAMKISDAIVTALDFVTEKIKSIDWSGIGLAISDFLTHIDFSGILVGLTTVFGEAILGFQDLFLAIKWPKIFKNLGNGIADAFSTAIDYVKRIDWSSIGTMLSETITAIPWGEIGSNILTLLWESLKGIVDLVLGIDWSVVGQTVSDAVHDWISTIIDLFAQTDWLQLGKDIVDAIFDFIENIDWGQLAVDIITGLAQGIVSLIQLVISAFAELIDRILQFLGIHSPSTLFADIGKKIMEGLVNGIKGLVNSVINIFKGLVDKIKSIFKSVIDFFKGIIDTIIGLFKKIGTKVGDVISGAFKGVVNGVLSAIENILNFPIRAINSLIKTINKIPGINLDKLKEFNLPRLAKGGIINQPGRGILVGGSAIGGESGQEGVIPLTDSQQMALLGEAIGKYITVNVGVTNTMNGRVISKELKRIQNNDDFAYNR